MSVSVTRTLWMEQGVQWLLNQWGLSINQPGIGIGFKKHAPFVQPNPGVRVLIDDELVEDINCWLRELQASRRKEDHYKADIIDLVHRCRWSFLKIGEEWGMSRRDVERIYVQATSHIDTKVGDYYKLSTAKRRVIRLLMKAS